MNEKCEKVQPRNEVDKERRKLKRCINRFSTKMLMKEECEKVQPRMRQMWKEKITEIH